ncbi:MAG TPA: hypothetical protein VMY37_08760 [Thermoguttaceae bacterium]|nr:hypothetical protein [Thermoguttaceae bacterium]
MRLIFSAVMLGILAGCSGRENEKPIEVQIQEAVAAKQKEYEEAAKQKAETDRQRYGLLEQALKQNAETASMVSGTVCDQVFSLLSPKDRFLISDLKQRSNAGEPLTLKELRLLAVFSDLELLDVIHVSLQIHVSEMLSGLE